MAMCYNLVMEIKTKVAVKEIVLDRAEGPSDLCFKVTVKTWHDAMWTLMKWSKTAPDEGHGYDKVDFIVTWEDGEVYEGRYDMNKEGEDGHKGHDLDHHIRHGVAFQAHKPSCPGYFKGHKGNLAVDADEALSFIDKYLPEAPLPKTFWCCEKKPGVR